MIYRFDDPTCLNGWWDILPVYGQTDKNSVPAGNWQEKKYLVPSFYNKPADAVRKPGDKYFCSDRAIVAEADTENLFDAYGYPAEWSNAKTVWVRRSLKLSPRPGRRYIFIAEAIGPVATLFVNGKAVGKFFDYTLDSEADITDFVRDGENELAILLEDFDRDENGDLLEPGGNCIQTDMRGVQRNVWLVEKADIYIDDLTVVTSLRNKTLTLKYSVKNLSGSDAEVTLRPQVTYCEDEREGVEVPAVFLKVAAGGCAQAEVCVGWENPRLWDCFNPNLYWVTTSLEAGGKKLDEMTERFGFRELWIEKDKLLLNGAPLHLFSDAGHRTTPFCMTLSWNSQWMDMLKRLNMNHSRLHTHPNIEIVLDVADEKGLYITSESALHGSAGHQSSLSPIYWEHAFAHVRNLIKREKNHPCVILYSCENEMRWGGCDNEVTKTQLPLLRRLYNELDPTRYAYHEGDSTLWDETTQDMISRHYGKDVAGTGWWDHTRPLHSGEMCMYHYMGPNNMLQHIGDAAWEEYSKTVAAATHDMLLIAEDARANGVTCLGPWNISCHLNLRPHGAKKFEYYDYTAPGVKPLMAHEGSSEFEFWNSGEDGYHLQPGTEEQAIAFRPLAVIDTDRRSEYYPDAQIEKEIHIVNDTDAEKSGELFCGIYDGKEPLCEHIEPFTVGRGENIVKSFTLPPIGKEGRFVQRLALLEGNNALDYRTKPICCESPKADPVKGKIAVIGDGTIKPLLEEIGADYTYITENDIADAYSILILEKNSVTAGSKLNKTAERFCAHGSVIVLEQNLSLFAGVKLLHKPVLTAFIRAFDGVLTDGLDNARLAMWGDDPYTLLSGDSFVAHRMYRKDDGSAIKAIADSGEGDFGSGDLGFTPLFTTANGRITACQLRITDKYETIPAAKRLFFNMLSFADNPPQVKNAPKFADAADCKALKNALDGLNPGDALIVDGLDESSAAVIGAASGVKLALSADPDGVYSAVRAGDLPVLSGISNEDICGAERVPYCHSGSENITVADALLEPAAGLYELLVTCPGNCFVPLYVHGYSSEMMRSYMATRCYYDGLPEAKIVAGFVEVNGARVYISAFNPDPTRRERFGRYNNLLAINLGREQDWRRLLAGDCVPAGEGGSGYPTKVYAISSAELSPQTALHYTKYITERMNTCPLLSAAAFTEQLDDNGVCRAEGDTLFYYTVFSPTVRKNLSSNLGVPDPGAQTFLDITANGELTLYINSVEKGSLKANGSVCLPDLELEGGLNHILLRYIPDGGSGELRQQWRNILRRPETELEFTK